MAIVVCNVRLWKLIANFMSKKIVRIIDDCLDFIVFFFVEFLSPAVLQTVQPRSSGVIFIKIMNLFVKILQTV